MDFTGHLLNWYHNNKRDLPWRGTKDPYQIWLSEVMLQQTRVEQGLPYYHRFLAAFPSLRDLAQADESKVLKLWQGLGYYSRARNMLATARVIDEKHGGIFPSDYKLIRELKGIGDYTAAAIASMAFGLAYPVVDGNVLRFLARYFGIRGSIDSQATKNEISALAGDYICHERPGDFNQAMMEFGATVCKPANPACPNCVFAPGCAARKLNLTGMIPVRKPKAAPRHRFLHYYVITFPLGGDLMVMLSKRSGNDIWRNLYDFPGRETDHDAEPDVLFETCHLFSRLNSAGASLSSISGRYTHLLTHQRLVSRFYRFHLNDRIDMPFTAVPVKMLHDYPFPRLIERYLHDVKLI